MTLQEVIRERIRREGPLPFAAYAELALYHPELGYYARADRRSGRAGDFFTSVDLGPAFGGLLASQLAEMWRLLGAPAGDAGFDLVEAAAGSGRLARDLLDAVEERDPSFYGAVRLHLVERSPAARAAQPATLGRHAVKLASAGARLPRAVRGVILANELLDALPPHVLVMTEHGLREVYVDVEGTTGGGATAGAEAGAAAAGDDRTDGGDAAGNGTSGIVAQDRPGAPRQRDAAAGERFVERLGPLSCARVAAHVNDHGIALEPGWRAEVVPAAADWVREAVTALAPGFLILIDYGHEARELYSAAHAAGTLTTYHRHAQAADGSPAPWLLDPGARDITAHVDLTAVRRAAERAGARTLGVLDQTYFLLGLGAADQTAREAAGDDVRAIRTRLALKSLLVPGGLGSTHKVLLFGKDVGAPALSGLSFRVRAT